MTDEQIVKALECCSVSVVQKDCLGCSYSECSSPTGCLGVLIDDSLDLIKRQQAEIERLQKESADKERAYTDEFCCRKEWQRKCRDLLEEKIEVKCKAVREFAEFLIDKAENNVIRIGDLCDYVIDFNEMTEGKKNG